MVRNILKTTGLAIILATSMLAQGYGPRGNGMPPDPATMVQNQVSRLTTLLGLTPDQASQATTIFTTAANTVAPLETSMNTNRQSLQTAIKNNATATIDQLCATIGTLSGQMLDAHSKADAAFRAILTADQQAKLDQLPGMGRGGFGGRPPMRP